MKYFPMELNPIYEIILYLLVAKLQEAKKEATRENPRKEGHQRQEQKEGH